MTGKAVVGTADVLGAAWTGRDSFDTIATTPRYPMSSKTAQAMPRKSQTSQRPPAPPQVRAGRERPVCSRPEKSVPAS
ncbi:MAG TPA: hypothetical protein VIK57_05100 [Streptosporangiaceae bacterium]